MKKIVLFICILFFFKNSSLSALGLVDPKATAETKSLFHFLLNSGKKQILFGHQEDMTKGIGWVNNLDSSEVKSLINDYPAVFGWDIGGLEKGMAKNISGVQIDLIRKGIKKAYRMGAINTLSWHLFNPVNPSEMVKGGKTDSTIYKLFRNRQALERYNSWMREVGIFFKSLKTDDGHDIPLILRLFHENNGNWFWWGKSKSTPLEYERLWKYTVSYLRDTLQVHNLIYAYCTDKVKTESEFLERYPGDEWADVIGIDIYDTESLHPKFVDESRGMLKMLNVNGRSRNKPIALMETGYKLTPVNNWWTDYLYPAIKNSGIAYFLVWQNNYIENYWGPTRYNPSSVNFIKFYKKRDAVFLKKLLKQKIYSN